MTAYLYITLSLLFYPIIGYFFVRLTRNRLQLQKRIVISLVVLSLLTILGLLTHTITISQNLNWYLVTGIYLAISVLLWLTQYDRKNSIKLFGKLLMIMVFGSGYLCATFGFFFVILAAADLDTDRRIWLTNDIVYKERDLGTGFDPDIRLKKIEVFRKLKWFPLIAARVKTKTYAEWTLGLKSQLDVSYLKEKQTLYLSSEFKGNKKSYWADTIQLAERR